MSAYDWLQLVFCGLGSVACVWAFVAKPEIPRVVLLLILVPLSTIAATQGANACWGDEYLMSQGLRDTLNVILLAALAGSVIWAFKS